MEREQEKISEYKKVKQKELLEIYNRGPESILTFVEKLFDIIEELTKRIKELEDRWAKDSHNSSKPPSTDIFRNKIYSQRQISGRNPGGQKGHPGNTLKFAKETQ